MPPNNPKVLTAQELREIARIKKDYQKEVERHAEELNAAHHVLIGSREQERQAQANAAGQRMSLYSLDTGVPSPPQAPNPTGNRVPAAPLPPSQPPPLPPHLPGGYPVAPTLNPNATGLPQPAPRGGGWPTPPSIGPNAPAGPHHPSPPPWAGNNPPPLPPPIPTPRRTAGHYIDLVEGFGEARKHAKAGGFDSAASSFENVELGLQAASGNPMAMMRLAKKAKDQVAEKFEAIGEGFQNVAARGGKLMSSRPGGGERLGDIAANTFGAGEDAAAASAKFLKGISPLGAAMAKAAEAGFKLAKQAAELFETFRGWNDQLIESNIKFAQHSAAMTQVEVSMERFRIEMDQVRGGRRAEAALAHAESVQGLERQIAKFEDAFVNFKAGILTWANNQLTPVLEGLAKWLGMNTDMKSENTGMTEEADQAYRNADWIDKFGMIQTGNTGHPTTPRPRI